MVILEWMQQLLSLINTPIEIKDKKDAISVTDLKSDISLRDVSFSYNNDSIIFNNLSFKIKKDSLIGIVGKTGGGG